MIGRHEDRLSQAGVACLVGRPCRPVAPEASSEGTSPLKEQSVIVGVAIGAVVLVPSLMLLFGLFLEGAWTAARNVSLALYPSRVQQAGLNGGWSEEPSRSRASPIGTGSTVLATGWGLAAGIVCLFASAASAFVLATIIPNEEESPKSMELDGGG